MYNENTCSDSHSFSLTNKIQLVGTNIVYRILVPIRKCLIITFSVYFGKYYISIFTCDHTYINTHPYIHIHTIELLETLCNYIMKYDYFQICDEFCRLSNLLE